MYQMDSVSTAVRDQIVREYKQNNPNLVKKKKNRSILSNSLAEIAAVSAIGFTPYPLMYSVNEKKNIKEIPPTTTKSVIITGIVSLALIIGTAFIADKISKNMTKKQLNKSHLDKKA